MVGSWQIADIQPANLPQKVATAFSEVTAELDGAGYIPALYCGEQLVHGTNYMVIAKQTLTDINATEHIVKIIINVSENGSNIVSIDTIL